MIASVGTTSAWIGANDKNSEGVWQWVQGSNRINEEIVYNNWRKDEPNDWDSNEDCAERRNDGLWNDVSCSELLSYICQYRIPPTVFDYQLKFTTSSVSDAQTACTPQVTIDFIDTTIDAIVFSNYTITGSTSITTSTDIERRSIGPAQINNVVMKPLCTDGWMGTIVISTATGNSSCTYNNYDEY